MAYAYARNLPNHRSKFHAKDIKHILWIPAGSAQAFQEGYARIAIAIQRPCDRLMEHEICQDVKDWLEKVHQKEPWFLILDGLDSGTVYNQIKGYLPSPNCGRMLVTSKNRAVALKVVDYPHCHHVDEVGDDVAWQIFKYHRELGSASGSNSSDGQNIRKLWKRMFTPLMIRLTAQYMCKHRITEERICDIWNSDIITTVKELDKRFKDKTDSAKFMEIFLRPALESAEAMEAFKLLFTLACFDTSAIEVELIYWFFNNHDTAGSEKRIALLRDFSFLQRRDEFHYRIPDLIRDGVLAWLREKRDEYEVWKWNREMLRMLHMHYLQRVEENSGNQLPYSQMSPFMGHFGRFCSYIKNFASKIPESADCSFETEHLDAIINFSLIYLEGGHPGQAVEILDYASQHSQNYTNSIYLERCRFRAVLARNKVLQHTLSRDVPWAKAERLCKDLLNKPEVSKDSGNVCERQNILLDLAWCHRLQKKWGDARKILDSDELKMDFNDDGVPAFLENGAIQAEERNISGVEPILRAIRESGELYLARAENLKSDLGPSSRASLLAKAKQEFRICKRAAEFYSPQDQLFIAETIEAIAKSCLKNGSRQELRQVERDLRNSITVLDRNGASFHLISIAQMILAEVRVASDMKNAGEEIGLLKKVFQSLKHQYGGSHQTTIRCSELMAEMATKKEMVDNRWRRSKNAAGWILLVCLTVVASSIYYDNW